MADYSYTQQITQFAKLIIDQGDDRKQHPYVIEMRPSDVQIQGLRTPPEREMFTEQTVDELGRIRDTIIERGWIQGNARTADGVCLLGGIGETVGWHTRRQAVLAALLETYLGHLVGLGRIDIPAWNDSPVRTVGEVIKVLDDCIVWVKGKIDNG
jgi:hypothetical protein